MNLPSVEFLKDQAARLVTYMGDKHRFRLKAASSLEAIAALYKQPDWNTCQAMAQRSYGTAATTQRHVVGSAKQPTFSSQEFALTWANDGWPDLAVSSNDWYRHTLATGGTKATRQAWLQQHFMSQLGGNGPGVFLNTFGGEMPTEAREALLQQGLLINLNQKAPGLAFINRYGQPISVNPFNLSPVPRSGGADGNQGLTLNLMADMSSDEIAEMLVSMLFPTGHCAGDDFWKQSTKYILTVVVAALREAERSVTLATLADLFSHRPDTLGRLPQLLSPDSIARHNLEAILPGFAGGPADKKTWSSCLAVLMDGLPRLAQMPWTPALLASASDAKGLFSLLSEGKCLAIEGPEDSDGQAEKVVLYALRSALVRRYAQPLNEKVLGWVFALGELNNYLAPNLAAMAAYARSGRTAILMTAPNAEKLQANPVGAEVLANTWNQLKLGGFDEASISEIIEALRVTGTVLQQPDRIQINIPAPRF